MKMELDDFHTAPSVLDQLEALKDKIPDLKITAFALLALCDPISLKDFATEHEDWLRIGLHGWSHYTEHKWNYWEARHFFEMAESLGKFSWLYKSPWNRLPRPGFLVAMKETNYCYVTPKKWQAVLLRLFGVPCILSQSLVWHPFELGTPNIIQVLKRDGRR